MTPETAAALPGSHVPHADDVHAAPVVVEPPAPAVVPAPVRVVHQLWFNFRQAADITAEAMPAFERECAETMRALCAKHGWAYKLWVGPAAVQRILDDFFAGTASGALRLPYADVAAKDVVERMHMLPAHTQRHEFLRWLILFVYGGVYADLDVTWNGGDVPEALWAAPLTLFREAPNRIANSLMFAAAPGAAPVAMFIVRLHESVWKHYKEGWIQTSLIHLTGAIGIHDIHHDLLDSDDPDVLAIVGRCRIVEAHEGVLGAPPAPFTHHERGLWATWHNAIFGLPGNKRFDFY